MTVFDVKQGNGPILLSQPHGGTFIPDPIADRLNQTGQDLADTDWHITQLYEGLLKNVTIIKSNIHRYVIDVNRDPTGASLYPGQNTTHLCPITDFNGQPIWREGQEPSNDEIAERIHAYHIPYHAALNAEIARIQEQHGIAIVYDCHSIRSTLPFLFEGQLPIFNIGTNSGQSCTNVIKETVMNIVTAATDYNNVLNGRFKGGWTTRHYGQPSTGIHAIQMEIAQRAYMHETAPWHWREEYAQSLRPYLQKILHQLEALALSGLLNEEGGYNA